MMLSAFRESAIRFLPTYRRHKQTGQFELHNRIPGYADRVLYKTTDGTLVAQDNAYMSLPIKGNDHLPITHTFSLTQSLQ